MQDSTSSSSSDSLLIDATQRLLRERCTRPVLESAESGHWPAALWKDIEDVGLPLAARSEARGGVGASVVELAQIFRLAGRHALPLPLVETCLAEQMLAAAGLPPIDGPLTVGPALHGEALTLRETGAGYALSGRLARVPWGRDAQALVVVALDEAQRHRTVVLRGPQVQQQGRNYAFEPRDTFDLRALAVPAADVGPARQGWTTQELLQRGALARSVQIAGAMERCLEQTVQYANDRIQFGKPIGKFQAVQHQIAQMASQVAATLTAALSAAAMVSPLETAMAKTRASEAAGIAAGVAHQVLGAIGFTHEHMLHFSTRRLWSWRDEFGSDEYWAVWVGQELARHTSGEDMWAFLTAGDLRVGHA